MPSQGTPTVCLTMTNLFFLFNDLTRPYELQNAIPLAEELHKQLFRVSFGVLSNRDTGLVKRLLHAGIPVHLLPVRHVLDMSGAWRLRQVIQETRPQIIHAWGPMATRLARLAISSTPEGNDPRLVVTGASSPGSGFGGWVTTRMLRRADRVIARTWAEAARYRQLKVSTEHLTRIVPTPAPLQAGFDRNALLGQLGLPPSAQVIVTIGLSEEGVGPRDAIVTFDMLRYEFPDLHLLVVSDSSESQTLEQFARGLAYDDYRVHIISDHTIWNEVIQAADLVLITRPRDGIEDALTAMASRKAVISWNSPDLVEIIDDGNTGYVVPVGDRATLASKTRQLLCDPALAEYFARNGHERVTRWYNLPRWIKQHLYIYSELTQ